MSQLPRISGREVVKVFESLGWLQVRQSGNHIILVRESHPAYLSVPDHKEVAVEAKYTSRLESAWPIQRWWIRR